MHVDDGWRGPRPPLLNPAHPPQHLHGLRGSDSGAGEVERYVGEGGDVLRLLDEVRDACRTRDRGMMGNTPG